MRLQNRTIAQKVVLVISLAAFLSLPLMRCEVFAQATSVRIAFNGFGGVAPLYLGQDAGILKKQNLTLEMIFNKLPERQMAETVFDGSLRATPDDGRPTIKGMEVVLAAAAKENPKAKGLTVQQIVDLRYIP